MANDQYKVYNIDDFSETEHQTITSIIRNKKESWETSTQNKRDIMVECRNACNNVIGGFETPEKDKGEQDINIPVSYTIKRTARARLANAIFSDNNWLAVMPVSSNDDEFTLRLKNYLDYKLDKANFEVRFKKVLDALLEGGDAITKVEWKEVKRPVRKSYQKAITKTIEITDDLGNPLMGEDGNPATNEEVTGYEHFTEIENKTVSNGPVIKLVDSLNVFFDITKDDFIDADLVEKTFISYNDLETANINGVKVYSNLEDIKEAAETRTTRDDVEFSITNAASKNNIDLQSVVTDDNIEVWHFFGDLRFEDDNGKIIKLNSYVATIAEESVLIRLEPYYSFIGLKHPYVRFECMDDARNPMASKGIVEGVLALQKYINDTYRMSLAIMRNELGVRIVSESGVIDQDMAMQIMDNEGNLHIELPPDIKIDQIQEWPFKSNIQMPMALMENLKQEVEKMSGVTSVATAQFDKQKQTATAETIRHQALDIRMGDILSNIKPMLEQLIKVFYEYCRMFGEDKEQVRVNEDNGYTLEEVYRDELEKTDLDFDIETIRTYIDKQKRMENLMQAYQLISSNPLATPDMIASITKEILYELGLNEIADKVFAEESMPMSEVEVLSKSYGDVLMTDPQVQNALMQSDPQQQDQIKDQLLSTIYTSMQEVEEQEQGQEQGQEQQ